MTEPEAEALVDRLTRIWAPHQQAVWTFEENYIDLVLQVEGDIHLFYEDIPLCEDVPDVFPGVALSLRRGGNDNLTGWLFCQGEGGDIQSGLYSSAEPFLQFANEWIDFFRRGCWLSGCPIEASAHEKVEWAREFTKEEVESWNLKM